MAGINQLVEQRFVDAYCTVMQKMCGMNHMGVRDGTIGRSERAEAAIQVNRVRTAFFRRPETLARDGNQKMKTLIAHAMTVKSDIPQVLTDALSLFTNEDNFDLGYEASFATPPVDPGKEFWYIVDMFNGVQVRKIPEGGRVVVEGISGELATVFIHRYGSATGHSEQSIRYRRIEVISSTALAQRAAWNRDKSQRHYTLLSPSSANITPYDTTATDTLNKDIATINAAADTLARRMKDKYVGNVLTQPYILRSDPILWSRIIRALRQTGQDVDGQPNRIQHNIRYQPTYSEELRGEGGEPITTAVLDLPGFKHQSVTTMPVTSFMQFDPMTLGFIDAQWSDWGAAGNKDQIQGLRFV